MASRVQDQRAWYSRKSEFNQKRAITLFSFVLVAQLVAVAGLIARIIWPEFPANPASVLASVAAALLAWLQLRRHQELAQSYALAAQDLGIVEARASSVTSDQTLADFVADAENAVSREHAMWLARRETR